MEGLCLRSMAGFTYLDWVDTSLPRDHLSTVDEDDEQSMVYIVEQVQRCGELLEKSSKPSSYKKLRAYLRHGISPMLRPNAWKVLSGGYKTLDIAPTLFQDIQDDLEYALFTGANLFFNASFVNKFYLTEDGWKKCQEVLAALSKLHCDVTFCPILQQLVCIFMHFMDKEDCFLCIEAVFLSRKYNLDKSVTDFLLTAKTFQDALKVWKRSAYVWFKSLYKKSGKNRKKQIFFLDWLQWIFKYLDFWTVVHIVDNFLLDGSKVFYRIGLVLFDEVYNLLKSKGNIDPDELEKAFIEVASSWSTQSLYLLNVAFKISGVSRRILSDLRRKNEALIGSGNVILPDVQDEVTYCGRVDGSDLLSVHQVQKLFSSLPRRLRQLCKLTCLFSTEVDGASFKTFYQKCEEEPYTLLLIKTTDHEIFGAFLSAPWKERYNHHSSFFGNGETFLFSFSPEFIRFTWSALSTKNWNSPSLFMLGNAERIVIGGGHGWGISIEADLIHGRSEKCDTFNNEPLASGNGGDFECLRVEVWCLEETGHLGKFMNGTEEKVQPKFSFFTDAT